MGTGRKRGNSKEKRIRRERERERNMDKAHVQLHMGIFVQKWFTISPFNFLSILEKKNFLVCPKKKYLGPVIYFPTQPNILQKSFPFHFLSKVFYPPYFTSKQTHPEEMKRDHFPFPFFPSTLFKSRRCTSCVSGATCFKNEILNLLGTCPILLL